MHQTCVASYDWIACTLCRSSQYVSRNSCSTLCITKLWKWIRIKQNSYFRWIDKLAVNLRSQLLNHSQTATPHHTQLPLSRRCLGILWVSITAHLISPYTPTSLPPHWLTRLPPSLPLTVSRQDVHNGSVSIMWIRFSSNSFRGVQCKSVKPAINLALPCLKELQAYLKELLVENPTGG